MGNGGEGWARRWRAPAAPGEGNGGEQASEPNPYRGRAQARDCSRSGRRRDRCRHRGRGDQGGEIADTIGTVISRGRERIVTGATRLARVVHDSSRSVPTMRSALPRAPMFPYSVPHRPSLTRQSYTRRIPSIRDYGVMVTAETPDREAQIPAIRRRRSTISAAGLVSPSRSSVAQRVVSARRGVFAWPI